MATLRDTIQSEIVTLEATLQQKKQDLVNLETIAPDFLSKEIDAIKQFFSVGDVRARLGL